MDVWWSSRSCCLQPGMSYYRTVGVSFKVFLSKTLKEFWKTFAARIDFLKPDSMKNTLILQKVDKKMIRALILWILFAELFILISPNFKTVFTFYHWILHYSSKKCLHTWSSHDGVLCEELIYTIASCWFNQSAIGAWFLLIHLMFVLISFKAFSRPLAPAPASGYLSKKFLTWKHNFNVIDHVCETPFF